MNVCGIISLPIMHLSVLHQALKESVESWKEIMPFSLSKPFKSIIDFFMIISSRSTTSEYNIMRNCDLTSIGGLLDSKGYGFGVPPST